MAEGIVDSPCQELECNAKGMIDIGEETFDKQGDRKRGEPHTERLRLGGIYINTTPATGLFPPSLPLFLFSPWLVSSPLPPSPPVFLLFAQLLVVLPPTP